MVVGTTAKSRIEIVNVDFFQNSDKNNICNTLKKHGKIDDYIDVDRRLPNCIIAPSYKTPNALAKL